MLFLLSSKCLCTDRKDTSTDIKLCAGENTKATTNNNNDNDDDDMNLKN